MPVSDFSEDYLHKLVEQHRGWALDHLSDPAAQLLMYSGAMLNWVGEFVNDADVSWQLTSVPVDSITLTGMNPTINAITIDRAERKSAKLREILDSDDDARKLFEQFTFSDFPILLRRDGDELKVLDGMQTTIAAIRDGKTEIQAYIGESHGQPKRIVEPHVVYDFLRAYKQQGGNKDDLAAALRFLLQHYTNVRELLQTRFANEWMRDDDIAEIISGLLEENN